MAKITVAGDAIVVTSSIKFEDIKTIAKYRPEKLTLMGGKDGKEPVFALGVTSGSGSINEFGASFGRETNNADKLATMTLVCSGIVGDVKEYVADKIGGALAKLNALEATLPDVLAEIAAAKGAIMDSITVMQ